MGIFNLYEDFLSKSLYTFCNHVVFQSKLNPLSSQDATQAAGFHLKQRDTYIGD